MQSLLQDLRYGIRQLLKNPGFTAVAGIVIGAAVALALARSVSSASFELTRFISGFLFGVSASDPATFGVIAALLIIVALLACYLPARRATRVDSMVALRCE
ncbi:MAG: hypothetical protein MOB07_02435 [Acidobacteria bacterium]|nr:hypothetical protein [Acidobacteriota bacterium]